MSKPKLLHLCCHLLAGGSAMTQPGAVAPTHGPLHVHPDNPRCFVDTTGKPV